MPTKCPVDKASFQLIQLIGFVNGSTSGSGYSFQVLPREARGPGFPLLSLTHRILDDYFQFNIGGYDSTNLLRINTQLPELLGFIGCVRGVKVGENLIDLSEMSKSNAAHSKCFLNQRI